MVMVMLCMILMRSTFEYYRYPQFSEEALAVSCPLCSKICNCKPCLRSNQLMKVIYMYIDNIVIY